MKPRPATQSDARGVAKVHVRSWQDAYRGIVPDNHLDRLSVDTRELVFRESIARGSPELWVAEADSDIIGWVAFGASRDKDAGPSTGEACSSRQTGSAQVFDRHFLGICR
jgi:hypothetical protein